ncbi:hypothetical protein [Massilia sp. CF038]|uniref:hypothetical protein n=1 Tax=Massilia sp. CF038 TaxID=1881045 RepID=UPI00091E987E|nr:hypothetical protein [Massilia sp. CF038]SHH72213.1 hypothetical protein SAMN05428948_5114 [Massilia sp. CF038]
MNASKLFIAIAAVAFTGTSFAADLPAASAAITSIAVTAAAPAGYAGRNLNVPSLHVNQFDTEQRAASRAQAVEAVKNDRSTFQIQLDFMKG